MAGFVDVSDEETDFDRKKKKRDEGLAALGKGLGKAKEARDAKKAADAAESAKKPKVVFIEKPTIDKSKKIGGMDRINRRKRAVESRQRTALA